MNTRVRRSFPWAAAVGFAFVGCGSSAREGSPIGDSSTGGAGTMPEPVSCPDSPYPPLLGVLEDTSLGCLDSETTLSVACQGTAPLAAYLPFCVEHIDSGERFWFRSGTQPALATGWKGCDSQDAEPYRVPHIPPPPPCFARLCPGGPHGTPGAPNSFCSEAETRALFECGGGNVWDENCCRRPECTTDADCPGGLSCRQAHYDFVPESETAWPILPDILPERSCDYGGATIDGRAMVCMPSDVELCSSQIASATCETVWGDNSCGACLQQNCCDATEACTADFHCAGLLDCAFGGVCAEDDEACMQADCANCFDDSAWSGISSLNVCARTYCATECGY